MHWTWKRFLGGVYSKMIEEIVPFSKEFTAVTLVAGEDTRKSSCEWICKFHLAETFCVRYMNFIFEDT